jgi:hypothetical protein
LPEKWGQTPFFWQLRRPGDGQPRSHNCALAAPVQNSAY